MKRVGFIINSRVPAVASLRCGMSPLGLATGWDDRASPMSFMRFRWIAEALRTARSDFRYELYRPWRTYEAVVFLKSMGPPCLALAEHVRSKGSAVIFEANVDYYSRFGGEARLDVMAPTAEQRSDATAITKFADSVIGSSLHLTEVCREINRFSAWIPDNVNLRFRPDSVQQNPMREGRLQVWWSGMAAKLFEFLAVEDAFLEMADRIHLQLVTDDVEKAKERWPIEIRARLENFLARVAHTMHRFRDIPHLMGLYATGGVIVSPRFLDAPYNLSHTEWKIALGMACSLPAIASPVPSYVQAANRSGAHAISIGENSADWKSRLEAFLIAPASISEAGEAAFGTVRRHYETGVVARQHAARVAETCARPTP